MALSVDWATKVIAVPQLYLTHISGNIYELDVNEFRLDLKSIEDSEEGIVYPDTHRHNTEVAVGGVTIARVVEMINGYTITFQDGQYIVTLTGANNNILDVTNLNQVSIRASNSAGLQVVTQGSGVTEQDKLDIADAVLNEAVNEHTETGTLGKHIDIMTFDASVTRKLGVGKWKINEQTRQLLIYDLDGVTPLVTFNLLDGQGNPTLTNIRERHPL